jgi:hypothetical protein
MILYSILLIIGAFSSWRTIGPHVRSISGLPGIINRA